MTEKQKIVIKYMREHKQEGFNVYDIVKALGWKKYSELPFQRFMYNLKILDLVDGHHEVIKYSTGYSIVDHGFYLTELGKKLEL